MRKLIQLFGVLALAVTLAGQNIEQTTPGARPSAAIVAQFDGLGVGFEGPQGTATLRNPSDNSLAVGPDHVVQIVNSRMAIFTKRGLRFKDTGRVLYGPVNTNRNSPKNIQSIPRIDGWSSRPILPVTCDSTDATLSLIVRSDRGRRYEWRG